MSAGVVAGVALLGGLGAVARFVVETALTARAGRRAFPFGTLFVNLSGTFVLGVLAGAALSGNAYRLVGTGLLGAFTTFSAWMFESERLASSGRGRVAAANLVGSLVLGLLAIWLGREVGRAF